MTRLNSAATCSVSIHWCDRRRAIGLAIDGDSQRVLTGFTIFVGQRVSEGLGQRFAVLERIHLCVVGSDSVGVTTVGIPGNGAVLRRIARIPSHGMVGPDAITRLVITGQVVARDVASHRIGRIFGDVLGVRISHWLVVHGRDSNDQRTRIRATLTITNGIGNVRHRATPVELGREGVVTFLANHQRALTRNGDGAGAAACDGIGLAFDRDFRDLELVALRIAVVIQHIALDRLVLFTAVHIYVGDRGLLHRCHRDDQSTRVRAAIAIRDGVGDVRHLAIPVGLWREGVVAVLSHNQSALAGNGDCACATTWSDGIESTVDRNLGDFQWVAIGVLVIA